MTIDILSATADAWFAVLSGAIASPLGTVVTNPKEGAAPPLFLLGKVSNDPWDGDRDVRQVTVETIVIYRGTDRSQLHAMMAAARAALEGVRLTAAGIEYDRMNFAGETSSGPGEDGVTHAGSIEHEVLAQLTD